MLEKLERLDWRRNKYTFTTDSFYQRVLNWHQQIANFQVVVAVPSQRPRWPVQFKCSTMFGCVKCLIGKLVEIIAFPIFLITKLFFNLQALWSRPTSGPQPSPLESSPCWSSRASWRRRRAKDVTMQSSSWSTSPSWRERRFSGLSSLFVPEMSSTSSEWRRNYWGIF